MKYTLEDYNLIADKLMEKPDYKNLHSIVKNNLICELEDFIDYMDEAYELCKGRKEDE